MSRLFNDLRAIICRPFTRIRVKMRLWRVPGGRPYRRVIRQDAAWFQRDTRRMRPKAGCRKKAGILLFRGNGAFHVGSPSPGARQGKAPCHAPGCDGARGRPRPTQSAKDRTESTSRFTRPIAPLLARGRRAGTDAGNKQAGGNPCQACEKRRGSKPNPAGSSGALRLESQAPWGFPRSYGSLVQLLRKAPQPQEPHGGCIFS
jgi:hypothetical protein